MTLKYGTYKHPATASKHKKILDDEYRQQRVAQLQALYKNRNLESEGMYTNLLYRLLRFQFKGAPMRICFFSQVQMNLVVFFLTMCRHYRSWQSWCRQFIAMDLGTRRDWID